MSRWPVEQPPKDDRLHINLQCTQLPDPDTFVGPLNKYIALNGVTSASVTAHQNRADYDSFHPEASRTALTPQPQPQPLPMSDVGAVSAGRPIHYQGGEVDPGIAARVRLHRPPPRPPPG
jgi:hypothetical protein